MSFRSATDSPEARPSAGIHASQSLHALQSIYASLSLAAVLFLPAATPVLGQTSPQTSSQTSSQTAPAIRITRPVDNASLVTLHGNVHPLAQLKYDRGAAAVDLPANRLNLVLKRSDQQEAALRQFLEATQDRKSSLYHKFLTPEQFGKQYGPSDADIQTITSWLGSQGFAIAKVSKGRTAIEFSGTVADVQKAFHTSIHSYIVNGEQHYANATDPQIPTALAPVVAGIARLNNFKPHAMSKAAAQARLDRASHKATPLFNDPIFCVNGTIGGQTGGTACTPNGTLEGYALVITPGDFSTIYDTKPLLASNIDGTNATIAIAGDSNIDPSYVQAFRTNFLPNYSATSFATANIIIDGSDPGVNSDASEAYLDVELAGGAAPNAKINFYTSAGDTLTAGLYLAIARAIDDNTADILNISFGTSEASLGTTGNQYINNLYEQAAAQGMTVFVSSGDSGSAGADDQNTETAAVNGLQVSGFASTPYNVAVGGTDFVYPASVTNAQLDAYWNAMSTTSANNNTDYSSAIQYIPEKPWNDSDPTLNQGTASANIAAAGGGFSNCAASTTSGGVVTCTGGYAKPSWQVGTGVPADGFRDIPDVSLFSADGINYSYYATCQGPSSSTGAATGDCATNGGPSTLTESQVIQISGYGGTSASSPSMAGIMAMIVQQYGRQGQANTVLYSLAAQQPSAFHDITVGTNRVACTAGSLNCGTDGYLTGYSAGTGYDRATGLGSVDANVLVTKWNSLTFTPTTTTLSASQTTVPVNQQVTFTVTVAGPAAGTTPTGDVAILTTSTYQGEGGQVIATLPAGTNGQTVVTIPYSGLPGGTYQVTARYAGDGTFATSTSSPVTMNVTAVASQIALYTFNVVNGSLSYTTSLNGQTINYGTHAITAIPIPASSTAPTGSLPTTVHAHGSIVITDNSTAQTTVPLSSNGAVDFMSLSEAVGSHSLAASYSGDTNSYTASTAGPVTVTIVKAPTTTVVTSSASTVAIGGSFTLTATLSSSSYGAVPSGSVTFMVGSTSVPATAYSYGYDSSTGAAAATATATILASQINSIRRVAQAGPSGNRPWWAAEGGLALASVLLFGIPARRRDWRTMLGAVCFLILAGSLGACGGSSSSAGSGSTTTTTTPVTSSITAVYSGDASYATSTSAAISVTRQ